MAFSLSFQDKTFLESFPATSWLANFRCRFATKNLVGSACLHLRCPNGLYFAEVLCGGDDEFHDSRRSGVEGAIISGWHGTEDGLAAQSAGVGEQYVARCRESRSGRDIERGVQGQVAANGNGG